MSLSSTGSTGSPSKESSLGTFSLTGSEINLPRDFSKISLFSSGSTTSSQDEHFRSQGHAEHSLSCMKNYLQAGKLCDVTLVAGHNGKKVRAHRLVLSAASEYFSAMFTGSLRDSQESEITLVDVNGDVLQAIVDYCYTGMIEIREDNVETLLPTACLMLLHEVVGACSRFLGNQLHPSNCLGIAVFAEHQSCRSLLEQAEAYTSEHFMQVVQNQEFLQLTADQMADLLNNDDLNVPTEESIFQALTSWIQHDPASRQAHLTRLLEFVKLPLLTPTFLTDQVEPVLNNDSDGQKLIMEALKWHLFPERRLQMMCSRTRPRKATLGRLLVVGGMDKHKGAMTIESYDPRLDSWSVAYCLSGRRLQFGIALMGDKLLVIGGRDGLKTLNIMECLDLETQVWSQLTPMNTHRHGLGVAVLGGTIYAVGGHDGWSYLNTVERWEPITRTWQVVAPMQSQRCSAGVAVLNGKLYAIGGRDGTSCLRSCECYDPHTNKWTTISNLGCRKGGVGVAVANGYIYAMGGQEGPANNPGSFRFDCVERYDPGTDTWTSITRLSNKRDAVGACLFGDKLFVVGGFDGTHYLSTVEQYNPHTNEWTSLAPLLTGRAGACVVAVGNQIRQKEETTTNVLTKNF